MHLGVDRPVIIRIGMRLRACLRTTVELLSALGAIKKDYQKIFGLSLYLILSNPIEISFLTMDTPYRTCLHSFHKKLQAANDYPAPEYFQQEYC